MNQDYSYAWKKNSLSHSESNEACVGKGNVHGCDWLSVDGENFGRCGDQWQNIRGEFRLEGCSVFHTKEKEKFLIFVHACQNIRLDVVDIQRIIHVSNRLNGRQIWQSGGVYRGTS